jgi:predicted metal-dependent HD superfamily phosphohydrolase
MSVDRRNESRGSFTVALRKRWHFSDELFWQLISAYSSRNRYYHTVEHLYHVLLMLEQLGGESIALNLAAWFHDAVYDTHAQDNEENSADLAAALLPEFAQIQEVRNLILCTKTHQAFDAESKILLDADLAILSAEPEHYQNYAAAIRKEYFWVTNEDYRIGRLRVLEGFLHRDRIYYTPKMHAKEAIARRNLEAELRQLAHL